MIYPLPLQTDTDIMTVTNAWKRAIFTRTRRLRGPQERLNNHLAITPTSYPTSSASNLGHIANIRQFPCVTIPAPAERSQCRSSRHPQRRSRRKGLPHPTNGKASLRRETTYRHARRSSR